MTWRIGGTTWRRNLVTRSEVAADCGCVVGNTVIRAVLPLRLNTGGGTEATPRLCRNAVASCVPTALWPPVSTATSSGEHRDGGAEAELGNKVEPDHDQARNGDGDRDAGEDDRTTGGVARRGSRVLR